MRLFGADNFRYRVAIAVLARSPLVIKDVRADGESPGASDAEVCYLDLVSKLTVGSKISVDKTGTTVRIEPGALVGGNLRTVILCADEPMEWYLLPLIMMGLFCRKPIFAVLKGRTLSDSLDDSFESTPVELLTKLLRPMLNKFGVDGDGLKIVLKTKSVGDGGIVQVRVPIVPGLLRSVNARSALNEINSIEIKASVFNVSPILSNDMVTAARALLEEICPELRVTSSKENTSGDMKGYSLVLKSTTDERSSSCVVAGGGVEAVPLSLHAKSKNSPNAIVERIVRTFLHKLSMRGYTDVALQPMLLILAATATRDASFINLGSEISPNAKDALRVLKKIVGVKFRLERGANGVVASCVGAGVKNLARTAA